MVTPSFIRGYIDGVGGNWFGIAVLVLFLIEIASVEIGTYVCNQLAASFHVAQPFFAEPFPRVFLSSTHRHG